MILERLVRPPFWARTLLHQVCSELDLLQPELEWLQIVGEAKSLCLAGCHPGIRMADESRLRHAGYYSLENRTVSVYVRTKPLGTAIMRLTLIHELAHHYLSQIKGDDGRGHSDSFYLVCWSLHRLYGANLPLAILKECTYQPNAEKIMWSQIMNNFSTRTQEKIYSAVHPLLSKVRAEQKGEDFRLCQEIDNLALALLSTWPNLSEKIVQDFASQVEILRAQEYPQKETFNSRDDPRESRLRLSS